MRTITNFINWVKELDINECDEHLRCQSSLIDLEHVNFVGKFENFEEDFSKVARAINLGKYDKNQLNQTKPTSSALSPSDIDELKLIYREDFLNFYPEEL